MQGVYAKDATKKENSWIGVIEAESFPSSINPQKGYIVNANNRVSSHLISDTGVSHANSMEYRAARIAEHIEELKARGKPIKV